MSEHAGIKLIATVKLSEFTNRSLVLCSQFSRELKTLDGKGLMLRDPLLPKSIAKAMRNHRSEKLTALFEKLLAELRIDTNSGNAQHLDSAAQSSAATAKKDSYAGLANKEQTKTRMYRGTPVVD